MEPDQHTADEQRHRLEFDAEEGDRHLGRHLADAEVWTPEPNDPYAMVNRHVQALEQADHARMMTPLIGKHALEVAVEQVTEHGARHDLVVEPGVAETLRSDEDYAPLFRQLAATSECTIAVSPDSIPFFLGVFDDEIVQIGVDDDSEPRALLETDARPVRAWARDTLDAYEQRATTRQWLSEEETTLFF